MAQRRGRRKKPFKLKLRKELVYTVVSILFLILSLMIALSFTRQVPFLEQLYIILVATFGWTVFILPFLLISISLMMLELKWALTSPTVFVGGLLIMIGSLGLTNAGVLGEKIYLGLSYLVSGVGSRIINFLLALTGVLIITNTPLEDIVLAASRVLESLKSNSKDGKSVAKDDSASTGWFGRKEKAKINISGQGDEIKPIALTVSEPKAAKVVEERFESQIISEKNGETKIWRYPPTSLLSTVKGAKADRGDISENAETIEQTLSSFNIKANVVEVNGGPAVTQYAIKIAGGTKLSKIKALQTDLALALAAPTGQIRIEAPIPGRNLVGIEAPNRSPAYVTLHEILTHPDMKKEKSKLAVGLGLGVTGSPAIVDIKRMPHALIAGATNSGKSISINNIICTLLFRNSPSELKFIMVDPKRVELTGYNGIPHLLTPVITEPDRVVSALEWTTNEMDKRYKMFAEVGVRNIEEYNEKSGFTAMNYIILVIDELADVMMFAPARAEELITRLAQMARATGIHLLLATQRPSVNVITGLIKANIPTRIAFNVTSMIDSRVIIDSPGAEKLLGRGDMLYVPPDRPLPTRIQGTYVTNNEINGLISFLKSNQDSEVVYEEEVTEKFLPGKESLSGNNRDELFDVAAQIAIDNQKLSTSFLQRKLQIGYNKAANIIEQLEEAGVIGAANGSKPRNVLISSLVDLNSSESENSN